MDHRENEDRLPSGHRDETGEQRSPCQCLESLKDSILMLLSKHDVICGCKQSSSSESWSYNATEISIVGSQSLIDRELNSTDSPKEAREWEDRMKHTTECLSREKCWKICILLWLLQHLYIFKRRDNNSSQKSCLSTILGIENELILLITEIVWH